MILYESSCIQDWGDGSVYEVLNIQAWGSELHPLLNKISGMLECTCNPSAEDVETRESWSLLSRHPIQFGILLASDRLYLKGCI